MDFPENLLALLWEFQNYKSNLIFVIWNSKFFKKILNSKSLQNSGIFLNFIKIPCKKKFTFILRPILTSLHFLLVTLDLLFNWSKASWVKESYYPFNGYW